MRFSSHYKMEGDDIIDYVFEHTHFFDSNENLVCEEIGDGNINYVYRIFDTNTKKSLILKQADVQTRVRPDGYLNPDRSIREAEVLKLYNECAPGFSPKIIYADSVMAAIIMEDIGSYSNLRMELMAGKIFYGIEELIARFIVDTSLPSTDLVLAYQKKFKAAAKFYNPDLCKITEDLVFTHPYKDVRQRNILLPENADWLKKKFYEDSNLIARVAILKEKFNNYPQGLIHGDLHSGSIFVKNENEETKIKIIDPEFAFYGPIAYDLGNVLAHFIFAQGYAKYSPLFIDEEKQRTDFLSWLEDAKNNLFKFFHVFAKDFLVKNIKDPIYQNEILIDNYIEKIKIDAVSFCGTELNRRIIGSAKTAEITNIKKIENRIALERDLAELGCAMILNPEKNFKRILSLMKVLVGLSGGVDSAVAAKLLIDQGYDVTGVTMQLLPKLSGVYKEQTDDIEDAKKVADKLGIKHIVYDMRESFKAEIIDYFVEEYKQGRTPNPCFICNSKIKFGLFLEQALKDGFDKIATGHYAKIEKTEIEGEKRFLLRQAEDVQKDQSYFLALLTQEQLSRSIFPLGDFTKEKVRSIAEDAGLINAHRPDSQDICFVPDDDYTKVINALAADSFKEGKFVDTRGNEIGRHKGLQYYTIGQRRGLAIAMGYPVYVVKKDAKTNTVTVGKDEELFAESLIASRVNIISKKTIDKEIDIEVKTRYRQQKKKAKLIPLKNEEFKPTGKFKVEFIEPEKAVAEGQAAVFYTGDYIIGGGIIESVDRVGIL